MNTQIKPKPVVSEDKTAHLCNKCAGTGLYVMEMRNGRPWSATGTTCFPCGGKGWIVKYKRGRKPQVAVMVPHHGADGKVTHWGAGGVERERAASHAAQRIEREARSKPGEPGR